jgi:hypothetical protein
MTMHSTSRQRLRIAAVGAVGLAVVLGSGLYMTTGAAAQPHPAQTVPPAGAQTLKAIKDARAQAAADGFPEMRPPGQQRATVSTTSTTENTAQGLIQITTAHGDLKGISPQALAGDAGKPAGDGISCTNKLRFSVNAPARTIPNMLLCFKTSAERSVVTMATAKKGSPSTAASTAIIAREWAKLG